MRETHRRMASQEREAVEAGGYPMCEEHGRELTPTPEGRLGCESCGWEAHEMLRVMAAGFPWPIRQPPPQVTFMVSREQGRR